MIESFCHKDDYPSGEGTGLHKTAFENWTPCFVDSVVLGPMHVTVIVFVLFRLWYLVSNSAQVRHRSWKSKTMPNFRVTGAIIATVLPLVILLWRLVLSPTQSAQDSVWSADHGGLAPFELLELPSAILVFAFVSFAAMVEQRSYVLKGTWILRFVFTFASLCHAIRFYHILLIYQNRTGDMATSQSTTFFGLYAAYFATLCLLTLQSIFYIPQHTDFETSPVLKATRAFATYKDVATFEDILKRVGAKDAMRDIGIGPIATATALAASAEGSGAATLPPRVAAQVPDIRLVLLECGWGVAKTAAAARSMNGVVPPSDPAVLASFGATTAVPAAGGSSGCLDCLFGADADSGYRLLDADDGIEPKTCPEAKAGPISTLLFLWLNPLLSLGHSRPLTDSDVWQLDESDSTLGIRQVSGFDQYFNEEKHLMAEDPKPRRCCCLRPKGTLRVLYRTFGCRFFFLGSILKLTNDAGQFAGPLFLKAIITFIKSDRPNWQGYLLVFGMCLTSYASDLGEAQYFQVVMRTGMRVRSALISKVFYKAMSLSRKARATSGNTGTLVNIMSSDTSAIQQLCQNFHTAWSSLVRVVVTMVLLFEELGWSCFVGLLVIILSIPIMRYLMGFQKMYNGKSKGGTDIRLKCVNETFDEIQVVKCYAWEAPFRARIENAREEELHWLLRMAVGRAFNYFVVSAVPNLVSVLTFAAYVALGNELTAAKAFTSLALFNVLKSPLYSLPQVLQRMINSAVSLERLDNFLFAEEGGNLPAVLESDHTVENPVRIPAGSSFNWDSTKASTFGLQDLKGLESVPRGSLVAVVGKTGSGKSSLLNALLGVMPQTHVGLAPSIDGGIAYVPQKAWIYNATVRANILFGRPFNQAAYDAAIRDSCLGKDLEQMDYGDSTEIGEKGVNMSGGQKQRLSLARALYSDADVLLLDDPLSALDPSVGRQIYEGCLLGSLKRKKKTVIFVTNRLEFVAGADRVVMLHREDHATYASVIATGTPQECYEAGGAYRKFMAGVGGEGLGSGSGDKETQTTPSSSAPSMAAASTKSDSPDPAQEKAKQESGKNKYAGKKGKKEAFTKGAALIAAETSAHGAIGLSVILKYVQAMGGYGVAFTLFFMYVFGECIAIGGSVWVTYWTDGTGGHEQMFYVGIYAAISFAGVIMTLGNQLVFAVTSVGAGRNLHAAMFEALIRAPMSFHYATPIGRILNRFTKDTADIDTQLQFALSMFVRGVVQLIGAIVLIGITTRYTTAVVAPILCVFYWIQTYYQATAREIKRMDAVTRSPISSHFKQCVDGIDSIRAYRAEQSMIDQNALMVDAHIRMDLCSMSCNRWLGVRLSFYGGIMVLSTGIFGVVGRDAFGAGVAGLALSYALQLTGMLMMTVRTATYAEMTFNAVERVTQYAEVEPEATYDNQSHMPPKSWPKRGAIEFKQCVARYRKDLDPVMKGPIDPKTGKCLGLSFRVAPAEKIGIVGRTGAGKSTLLLTLFRILELDQGQILIDGEDISKFGLKQLRSRLSIIPQEPVLFTGTLRSNLDPFDKYDTDEPLWDALRRARLASWVEDTCQPLGLLAPIDEGGTNLAAGERQLLCLARALLRVRDGCRVMIFDEATAAVDQATDDQIQDTIRTEFKACTTLTIAHRLRTIIDSDKILVLGAGALLEYASPRVLLKDPKSTFSGMVDDTKKQNAASLRAVAFGEVDIKTAFGGASSTDSSAASKAPEDEQRDRSQVVQRADSLFSTLNVMRAGNAGRAAHVALPLGNMSADAVPHMMRVHEALKTLQDAMGADSETAFLPELSRANCSKTEWAGMLTKYLAQLHTGAALMKGKAMAEMAEESEPFVDADEMLRHHILMHGTR